jgi:hypothetical protein
MEMVGGPGGALARLLLRSLRICEHNRARHRNVHALSGSNTCGRSSSVSRGAIAGLLFQSGRVADALRNNAGPDLLWRRLR